MLGCLRVWTIGRLALFCVVGGALMGMSAHSPKAADQVGPLKYNDGAGNPGAEFIEARLHVSDIDRSLKFYTEVIGLKVAFDYGRSDGGREIMLSRTGRDLEPRLVIHTPEVKGPIIVGNGLFAITLAVSDLAGIEKRALAAGSKILLGPRRNVPSKPAMKANTDYVVEEDITDPDGYTLHVLEFHGPGK